MSPTTAIEVENLSRTFSTRAQREVQALREVSFGVGNGEIVALLGENGAGKTTLTRILATLLLPTAGTARILGRDVVRDVKAARQVTSVIFGGDRGLFTLLNARENLEYFAMLRGVSRRDVRRLGPAALEDVGLGEAAGRPVETYSKGMRQRLHVAIGMLTRPPVLLLDEPTVGLDPRESQRLRASVAQLREAQGTTVILTSHNLLDVEQLAHRVVMLARGRVTHDLPLRQFAALAGYVAVVEVVVGEPAQQVAGVLGLSATGQAGREPDAVPEGALFSVSPVDGGCVLRRRLARWTPAALGEVAAALDGLTIVRMDVRPASLDEAFVTASSQGQRE